MPIILAVLIGISVFISGNYVYQHKGDFFPSPTPTAKIQDTITPTPQLNPTSTNIYIITTTLHSTNNQNTNNKIILQIILFLPQFILIQHILLYLHGLRTQHQRHIFNQRRLQLLQLKVVKLV